MADAMEMNEVGEGKEEERKEQEGDQEETNVDDGDDDRRGGLLDTSIPVPQGFNPDLEWDQSYDPIDSNQRQLSELRLKREFMSRALKVRLYKSDGPASKELVDGLELTFSDKSKRNNGAYFKGFKIFKLIKGKFEYTSDKRAQATVQEFQNILSKARVEHERTSMGKIEKGFEREDIMPSEQTVESIQMNVIRRVENRIDENLDQITSAESRLSLTDSEIREIPGISHIEEQDGQTPEEQISLLENIEKPHWEQRATEAEAQGKERRAAFLRVVSDTAQLKADEIRLKHNIAPESDEVQRIMDDEVQLNDLTKFERFKKWAKENLVGISAVAISVAGIITTVAISARSALKSGAKGLGEFAKGVYEVGKKVAPVFAAVLNLIGSILSWGAKGIEFLAKNLWLLALAITYFLYNEYKARKK